MVDKYKEPKTLDGVLAGVDFAIEQADCHVWSIERASTRITSLTLANNSLEIEKFYDAYPELVMLTDISADLEWQAEDYDPKATVIAKEEHDQWVQERWQELKDTFQIIKAKHDSKA